MIFHSLDFVVFFVGTTLLYWSLPTRGQNLLLVVASYVFYGWVHPWFLALIGTTTLVDFLVARGMATWPQRRRQMLAVSLVVNLGLLGFFKYFNFFTDNVAAVLAALGLEVSPVTLNVLLPVGISFYTFQELSYTVDVYRGAVQARRNLIDFAAFVSFFPQLVAGPIERATHLLPQIEQPRTWSWPLARSALFLMVWGYFKKLVIADNVGIIANKVFALENPSFPVLWAGVFAFAIQIYADFSAYSDIARGAARWLGFDLMVNFNHPYIAKGPIDFWRRWHISLSTWFRDYVYIPLGGSRASGVRTLVNVFVTFVVSGFWHGASWNYILWGAYHGGLVVLARLVSGTRHRRSEAWAALEPFQVVGTFGLVCIGWLLFRETDINMLWHYLTLSPFDTTLAERQVGLYLFLTVLGYSMPLWIESIWFTYVAPSLPRHQASATAWGGWRTGVAAGLAGCALFCILVFRSQQSLDFIYFQF